MFQTQADLGQALLSGYDVRARCLDRSPVQAEVVFPGQPRSGRGSEPEPEKMTGFYRL